MKIEIISGLVPNRDAFTKGSFVYDRIKCLHNHNIHFEIWMLEPHYSKLVQRIYHFLKEHPLEDQNLIEWDVEEKQNIIHYNKYLFPTIISKLFVRKHLKEMRILDKEMKLLETSLIHSHWVYPHGYVASILAKKHNIPCVVTAHGSDIHTIPRQSKINKKYMLQTLNSADKVIFVSHALLDSAKELGYSGENAVVIPNGIDTKYFYPMDKEEAMKKIGWKQTKRHVVGFVGNLVSVKRVDKFVEIFSEIQDMVDDVEFILVGDGDLADDIRSGTSAIGLTVTFAGRVPHEDVCYWMNLFDVMILPSRNESWGCVIQEAYACGVPVVGAAVGGIPENLGGLCPSVSEGDGFEVRFAAEVCRVLKGECLIDSKLLIDKAQSYTWDECVKKEIDVYLSIQH